MGQRVAVIWHQNMEEIEGVTPVDLLRRAGIIVEIFSADNQLEIIGSHGIKLRAEQKIGKLEPSRYAALILIGGSGTEALLENPQLPQLIQEFHHHQRLIGAICAAPQLLGQAKIVDHLKVTHFPGTNKFLENTIDLSPAPLVISGNIITSAGPGTAFEYSLALIEKLRGKATADKIRRQTVYQS